MLKRLSVAFVIVIGLSLSGFAAPPNVVIVLADDQGWGDLSVHGNTNLSTPRIDSLAHDGALFSRFYAQPVCAPTRAEMLTGRYHPRTGVRGVSRGQERMNVDESTLADMLQQAGYATGAFGKWHNGSQHPYHPNSRGFDEYYGFTSGHWGNYFDPMLEHNGEIVRGNGFIIDDLTAHAMDFIEANKEKPFLCYLAYNTPHSPFQVPEKFYKKFAHADLGMRHRDGDAKEELDKTRAALAMCENIDWNVGRVLDQLENLNLADNTIVIYYSDNGPNTYRWNNDMRGRKGMTDEGGVRVPCMVRWPAGGIQPGTRIDSIAGAIDLLPTLAEMTGAKRVGDKPIDGLSLAPMLRGENVSWPDRYIYSIRQSKKVSVRNQRYILDDKGQLYDLNTDPGQRTAINEQEPAVAAELARAVQQCQDEILLKDGTLDTRPFLIGGSEAFAITHIPVRDGVSSGTIERSGRAPNCSFFTHWTNKDDRMTWDVSVENEGLYEVTAYYSCPPEDVGSIIELSFGKTRLVAKINEAHDPPLFGAEHGRADRGSESYVKYFKPLTLGTMKLEKEQGVLSLRALDIPGDTVMEVRLLIFTRVM